MLAIAGMAAARAGAQDEDVPIDIDAESSGATGHLGRPSRALRRGADVAPRAVGLFL
jgi:hypothetical protein